MVCHFLLRLLDQKFEISKKRIDIVKNVPILPDIGTFFQKTYQYRRISAHFFKKRTKNIEDLFFSRESFCSAKIVKKQCHQSFCSSIYSWKKRGKVTGVAFMHCARHEFYYASYALDTYCKPNLPASSINSQRKQFDHLHAG